MTILIDNGHGIETPGKRSPDGLFREYSYTREIAHRVVSELSDCGYDARLLVPEIVDIPLTERCRRVNAICDEVGTVNVILVSIHVKASGSSGTGSCSHRTEPCRSQCRIFPVPRRRRRPCG
ncbi:MAG: N-acetylmuramoyl-L-alanine amidase [Bacteroidales bacterium]|nr:N-acetylmuramoyl-L-alanine amidase [Candidatus Cryptobacteroides choladohippi]